jgi:hypothetical protein
MRSSERWLASALVMAALVLVGAAEAQPPLEKKLLIKKGPKGLVPSPDDVEEMVARIMAFDKNKDGKVTRDELPERMHDLIARGDLNKDGALDRDEIRKLASTPGDFRGPRFAGAGGPIGFGAGVFKARFDGAGGPIREAVDDLKLSGKKKDRALAVVTAHQENVRKLMDQAHTEMLQKMKGILSEEEFQDFKAALDRPVQRFEVGPAAVGGPRELEQKLDRLQKAVDELHRQLRR